MDIDTILKIARTFFAGITAASTAIDIWTKFRSKPEAAKAFKETFDKTLESKEAHEAAGQLVEIIPAEVIAELEGRAKKCWLGYGSVLSGDFMPHEVDDATLSVQACVCRELGRLMKLNGSIPSKWQAQWERFDCANRDQGLVKLTATQTLEGRLLKTN